MIFLNLGAFFLVSKIGTRERDINKETKIKGWKFSGLLKFKKNIPTAIDP